jgi:hypothetical protein
MSSYEPPAPPAEHVGKNQPLPRSDGKLSTQDPQSGPQVGPHPDVIVSDVDIDIDPPPEVTADLADRAEPVEDTAGPPGPGPGTAAYATPPRGITTARIPAPRLGEHDRIPAPDEAAPDDGVARKARSRSAGPDTRRVGLARLLTEPEFEDAITAFVATAPPLPEDVRSRLARLLRTNECHDPADQEEP